VGKLIEFTVYLRCREHCRCHKPPRSKAASHDGLSHALPAIAACQGYLGILVLRSVAAISKNDPAERVGRILICLWD